mmetsp:Transcript_91008/g.253359  ORF Transcript_91008/g.253359 Transcript_91008/m.253359 type:complete len:317 (-) Transcript_91008:480-1430(-)
MQAGQTKPNAACELTHRPSTSPPKSAPWQCPQGRRCDAQRTHLVQSPAVFGEFRTEAHKPAWEGGIQTDQGRESGLVSRHDPVLGEEALKEPGGVARGKHAIYDKVPCDGVGVEEALLLHEAHGRDLRREQTVTPLHEEPVAWHHSCSRAVHAAAQREVVVGCDGEGVVACGDEPDHRGDGLRVVVATEEDGRVALGSKQQGADGQALHSLDAGKCLHRCAGGEAAGERGDGREVGRRAGKDAGEHHHANHAVGYGVLDDVRLIVIEQCSWLAFLERAVCLHYVIWLAHEGCDGCVADGTTARPWVDEQNVPRRSA